MLTAAAPSILRYTANRVYPQCAVLSLEGIPAMPFQMNLSASVHDSDLMCEHLVFTHWQFLGSAERQARVGRNFVHAQHVYRMSDSTPQTGACLLFQLRLRAELACLFPQHAGFQDCTLRVDGAE